MPRRIAIAWILAMDGTARESTIVKSAAELDVDPATVVHGAGSSGRRGRRA